MIDHHHRSFVELDIGIVPNWMILIFVRGKTEMIPIGMMIGLSTMMAVVIAVLGSCKMIGLFRCHLFSVELGKVIRLEMNMTMMSSVMSTTMGSCRMWRKIGLNTNFVLVGIFACDVGCAQLT